MVKKKKESFAFVSFHLHLAPKEEEEICLAQRRNYLGMRHLKVA